jgi:putative FmdB family regulatory protein
MPIYAYRCATCGHAQDVLQKMSDPLLTVCPACGAVTYEKQVTAAGFQLKGSGWYVTDFRNGNNTAPAKKDGEGPAAAPAADSAAAPASGAAAEKAASATAAAPASAPAAPSPAAPPPAPAAGS